MAATYHLLCIDCRRNLSLGKVYSVASDGRPLPATTLDGVYDATSRSWRRRDDFFGTAIEQFLIRHRNHHLSFVPEGVDELLESPWRPMVESVDETELVPGEVIDVDASEELAEWERKLKGPDR
jgi:hypothetical protein